MRKRIDLAALLLACSMTAANVSGCGAQSINTQAAVTEQNSETVVQDSQMASLNTQAASKGARSAETENVSVTAELGEGGELTANYEAEELDPSYDETRAVRSSLRDEITVSGGENGAAEVNGSTVTLKAGGIYILSGELKDGQIIVDGEKGEQIRIVLDGVTLGSSTAAPIVSMDKCSVLVTLAEGSSNTIADSRPEGAVSDSDENAADAAVYVKGDLCINGSGSLSVSSDHYSGIVSKNTLKLISGTYQVNAGDDALKGKDALFIREGQYNLNAADDALKATNSNDENAGDIWIEGGTFRIVSGDKGISAENRLVISGGEIGMEAEDEAFEGKTVDILGGKINAAAGDDGINAAAEAATEMEKQMDQEGVYLRIAGGEVVLTAKGDGIDSNGDFYMDGGVLYLSGPEDSGNGILDYNGTAKLTGGSMIAAGSAGMMQDLGEDAAQNYLMIYFDDAKEAGTLIELADDQGNTLLSYEPSGRYSAAVITSPDLVTGSVYTVRAGEETKELEITGLRTVSGEAAGFGFGGMPQGGGMRPDGGMRPEGGMRPDGGMRPEGGMRPDGTQPPEGGMGPSGAPAFGSETADSVSAQ